MVSLTPRQLLDRLVGFPTVSRGSNLDLIDWLEGGTGYRVHMKGYEVHSSLLPQGVSAIMEGARLIGWVNDQSAAIQAQVPTPEAARFIPPFTTLHVGMIEGGTAQAHQADEFLEVTEFQAGHRFMETLLDALT